jgi:hypothetical protein
MSVIILSSHQYSAILPDTAVLDMTCDNTTLTCDNTWPVDYLFIPYTKHSAVLPAYLFDYTLPELMYLSCDNTLITADNLITVDNS